MKKSHGYVAVVFVFFLTPLRAETPISIAQAIQKNLVEVKFTGAIADSLHPLASSHWGPCISLDILSKTTEALSLALDYGYKLVPEDSAVQTMMVTQNLIVNLSPKQRKKYRVFAMCTEAHDAGPSSTMKFKMGKRASGSLLGLAELLLRKKYQNGTAQDAVWCLTDDYDLSTINDSDTTMMYDLRRFVAQAKNIPIASIYNLERENSEAPERVFRTRSVYSGSLSYSVGRTAKVLVALFDEDNHMKTVYVNNEQQREGTYTYKYELSSDEMNNKKHYLRMFRDGKLEEEIAILP